MSDYSWEEMPEGLAQLLYDRVAPLHNPTPMRMTVTIEELRDWLEKNITKCAATSTPGYDFPELRCGELPVPGSEFCPLHMPPEEIGDNG